MRPGAIPPRCGGCHLPYTGTLCHPGASCPADPAAACARGPIRAGIRRALSRMPARRKSDWKRWLGWPGLTAAGMTTVAAVTGFLEPMSLLITIGGALGVVALTFSRERLESARQHLRAALVPDAQEAETMLLTFRRLARAHRLDGPLGLERAAQGVEDPFLARAVTLILESEDGEDIGAILLGEARARAADIEAARQVVLTLGRLFPAFGLIGTLIGLALLLRNLSGGNFASVAPGLGIAVLTTLYGSVMANVVILPLATRLQAQAAREALRLEMVIAGSLLLRQREYPSRIERVLRAYLGRAGVAVARPTRVTSRAA